MLRAALIEFKLGYFPKIPSIYIQCLITKAYTNFQGPKIHSNIEKNKKYLKTLFEGACPPQGTPNLKITKVHPFSGPQNSLKHLKKEKNVIFFFFFNLRGK
jgi:hypothetical protein